MAIAEFAEALLVIPKTLAVNAAQDATELTAKLRADHASFQVRSAWCCSAEPAPRVVHEAGGSEDCARWWERGWSKVEGARTVRSGASGVDEAVAVCGADRSALAALSLLVGS